MSEKLFLFEDDKPIPDLKIPNKLIKEALKAIGKAIKTKKGINEKIEIALDFIKYYEQKTIKSNDGVKYENIEKTLEHIILRYNKGNITILDKNGKYKQNLNKIEKILILEYAKPIADLIVEEYEKTRCFINKRVENLYTEVLSIL